MKTYTTFKDGVKITTQRINGKSIATLRYTNGETETVLASFPTLLRAKVDVTIKAHYSAQIKSLADLAREINASARRNKDAQNSNNIANSDPKKETDKIAAWWESVIQKIEKYYPNSRCNAITEGSNHPLYATETIWQFVANNNRKWLFDMLRRLKCNYNNGNPRRVPFNAIIQEGVSRGLDVNVYQQNFLGGYTYKVATHRYLNGNTLITIKRLKCRVRNREEN